MKIILTTNEVRGSNEYKTVSEVYHIQHILDVSKGSKPDDARDMWLEVPASQLENIATDLRIKNQMVGICCCYGGFFLRLTRSSEPRISCASYVLCYIIILYYFIIIMLLLLYRLRDMSRAKTREPT